MGCLASQSFDSFTLELHDQYLPEVDSVSHFALHIQFDETGYDRVVALEHRDALYSTDFFRSHNSIDGECIVCGKRGINHQFEKSPLQLHEECRETIEQKIEQFVDDISDIVVKKRI